MQRIMTVVRWCAPFGLLLSLVAVPCQNAAAQGRGKGSGQGNVSQPQQQNSRRAGNSADRPFNSRGGGSLQGSLSGLQLQQLLDMREEEKLAHDVYVALAKSSGLQIFNNISNAESKHMRAVEQLISRYASTNPTSKLPTGTFSNPQLQRLYTELVTAGVASPTAALKVGAKIEEMDIRDLQLLIAQNPPPQIAKVLENLQRASGNHLRAFMSQLQSVGATYAPEFLDQPVFDNIVNSGKSQVSSKAGQRPMGPKHQSGNTQPGKQAGKGNMHGRR